MVSEPPLGMHILHMGKHKPKTAPSLSFHPKFTSLKTKKRPGQPFKTRTFTNFTDEPA